MKHGNPKNDETRWLVVPEPEASGLTHSISVVDHTGSHITTKTIEEKPLTIWLNGTEIVTTMTIGDYPELLALGFLANQKMISSEHSISKILYDEELETVIVRTAEPTRHEEKLKKKTRTSGCAIGTQFGDIMAEIDRVSLPKPFLRTSWLYALSYQINLQPSLYLAAGAIHGTVLCQEDCPMVYMEDVGRHNAVDKIAGWMWQNTVTGHNKILYTTGRLTSEMVIKAAMMGISVLLSRSGFTASGVELARKLEMCMIGRVRGKRFICVSGEEALVFDTDLTQLPEEDQKFRRKSAQK